MKKYFVVFKKDNKITGDHFDPEMIEDVSSHDTFEDANWAYVEVRKANPTKLAGIISIGEDNIPRMTTMRVVVLHNEDGSHDFLVRGKEYVDVHPHAKNDVEMMEAYKTSLRMKDISKISSPFKNLSFCIDDRYKNSGQNNEKSDNQ